MARKSKWIVITNATVRQTREPAPAPKMNWGGPSNAKAGDICPCCWNPYVWIEDLDNEGKQRLVCACD